MYMAMHPKRKLPIKWLAPECMLDSQFSASVRVACLNVLFYASLIVSVEPYSNILSYFLS